jgi:hypothetical protein
VQTRRALARPAIGSVRTGWSFRQSKQYQEPPVTHTTVPSPASTTARPAAAGSPDTVAGDAAPATAAAATTAAADGSVSRRHFLHGSAALGTAVGAGSALLAAGPAFADRPRHRDDCELGPLKPAPRRAQAFKVRVDAALETAKQPLVQQQCNGDEARYDTPGTFALNSYSKGLPHDAHTGLVDADAYRSLLRALRSGRPADFEDIALAAPGSPTQRLLVNPQAGLAYDLQGQDSHGLRISSPANPATLVAFPPAPAWESAEAAAEMIENYWMALLRDVPFADYATHPLAARAAAELTACGNAYKGPKAGGVVTPELLFRDAVVGCTEGPYLSQFWCHDIPFGAQTIPGVVQPGVAGLDFGTSEADWLAIQDGVDPGGHPLAARRWMNDGRALSQWVHIDVLYQAYFQACLQLDRFRAPVNPGNPYATSRTQVGFGTFGGPYFKTVLAEVSTRALKAVWFQKWFVHRRARPEAYAGRLHHALIKGSLPEVAPRVHARLRDSLDSAGGALNAVAAGGSLFLPLAFPEGSPLHPSYGAGHATVAGACSTVLKYLFDGGARFGVELPSPRQALPDGSAVVEIGGELTLAGEIDKLACNVATGRNIAGVHWRSDALHSLLLGEQVALAVLREQRATYNERPGSTTFTGLLGNTLVV